MALNFKQYLLNEMYLFTSQQTNDQRQPYEQLILFISSSHGLSKHTYTIHNHELSFRYYSVVLPLIFRNMKRIEFGCRQTIAAPSPQFQSSRFRRHQEQSNCDLKRLATLKMQLRAHARVAQRRAFQWRKEVSKRFESLQRDHLKQYDFINIFIELNKSGYSNGDWQSKWWHFRSFLFHSLQIHADVSNFGDVFLWSCNRLIGFAICRRQVECYFKKCWNDRHLQK